MDASMTVVPEERMEVDYLILGAGAVGMTFYDSFAEGIKAEGKSIDGIRVLMVDQNSVPGGHWVHAYPFARLHAPSAFYGVESDHSLVSGLPADFKEDIFQHPQSQDLILHRASKMELLTYFGRVLAKFQRENREFRFAGNAKYVSWKDPAVRDIEEAEDFEHVIDVYDLCPVWTNATSAGKTTPKILKRLNVVVKKKIFHGAFGLTVPSLSERLFDIDPDVDAVPVNALGPDETMSITKLDPQPTRFAELRREIQNGERQVVVVGGGKTGQDAVIQLHTKLGVPIENIAFVGDNAYVLEIYGTSYEPKPVLMFGIEAAAYQCKAPGLHKDSRKAFEAMEEAGLGYARIDPSQPGDYYHAAVLKPEELATIRKLCAADRMHFGVRVKRVHSGGLTALVVDKKTGEERQLSFFEPGAGGTCKKSPIIVDCAAGVGQSTTPPRRFLYGPRVILNGVQAIIPATGQFTVSASVLGKLAATDEIPEKEKVVMTRSLTASSSYGVFGTPPYGELLLTNLLAALNMRDWLNAGLGPWMDRNRLFKFTAFGFGPYRWVMQAVRCNEIIIPFIQAHPETYNEGHSSHVANPRRSGVIDAEIEYIGGLAALRERCVAPVQFPLQGMAFPFAEEPSEAMLKSSPMVREMLEVARLEKLTVDGTTAEWLQRMQNDLRSEITMGVLRGMPTMIARRAASKVRAAATAAVPCLGGA